MQTRWRGAPSLTTLAATPGMGIAYPTLEKPTRNLLKGEAMSKISEKLKAIAAAVAAIEKQFRKGAVMQLGGESAEQEVPIIPSGSVGLDRALGIGG